MKRIAAAIALTMTTGCSQLMQAFGVTPSDLAPSLKYCQKVQYERQETQIRIMAECTAPVGSM